MNPLKDIDIIVKSVQILIFVPNAIIRLSINMIFVSLNNLKNKKNNLDPQILELVTDSKILENHSEKWIDFK